MLIMLLMTVIMCTPVYAKNRYVSLKTPKEVVFDQEEYKPKTFTLTVKAFGRGGAINRGIGIKSLNKNIMTAKIKKKKSTKKKVTYYITITPKSAGKAYLRIRTKGIGKNGKRIVRKIPIYVKEKHIEPPIREVFTFTDAKSKQYAPAGAENVTPLEVSGNSVADYVLHYDYKDCDVQKAHAYDISKEMNDKFLSYNGKVWSYQVYEDFCQETGVKKTYNDKAKKYIILTGIYQNASDVQLRIGDVTISGSGARIFYSENNFGTTPSRGRVLLFAAIPVPNTVTTCDLIFCHNIVIEPIPTPTDLPYQVLKPVIYLYPQKQQKVSVKLLNEDRLTCVYPKYNNVWDVLADPSGTLTDQMGRQYYCLYYENEPPRPFEVTSEGFCVKGSESAVFLENTLSTLGLNEKEAQEFIIYWLPILERSPYNYIRFASDKEIEENMGLKITPAPDTTIRILMTFKGLDKPIDVTEQKLEKRERKGFSVIEWGGSQIR